MMTREEFHKIFPELVMGYQPNPEVLDHIHSLTLLMLIGPSGTGKTTLMNRLGLPYVPSDVTRPKRPEEKEDIDYHFRTDYDRIIEQIKAGEFVQAAVGPGGDFYSTLASSYPRTGVAIISIVADVVPVFRDLVFGKTISAFIAPPTFEEWMRRLRSHDLAGDELVRRLSEARRSLIFALNDKTIHFILNDDIEPATEQLKNLLSGAVDDQREKRARRAALNMLDSI